MDIVGLGLATVDVLISLEQMPTWEATHPLSAFGLDGGGPVATACVAASRLGASSAYIGTVGSGLLGEIKLRTLQEYGVDLSQVREREAPESQVVLVYVNASTGERIFCGVHNWNQVPLQVGELDRNFITSAQCLHLDGTTHLEASLEAVRWMKQAGKMVSLDGSRTDGRPLSPQMVELVGLVDVLICGAGFGLSLTGQSDLWQAGRTMLQSGPKIVVQTEGQDGSYTVTREEQFHVPAFPVDVVDTTGAGDVFHGAFLVGLLQGWELQRVVRFATAVAAIKCTQLGGRRGIPGFAQAMNFLRERGYS